MEPNLEVLEQVLKIYDDEIFLLKENDEITKLMHNNTYTRIE